MFSTLPWTRDDESRGKHTGTFGEVHVWRRVKSGVKEMAVVKIPTVPQHIDKLRKERDKMLQVSHQNIVKCLNPTIFGDDYNLDKQYKNGIIWRDVLVMEYCDGGNLRKVFSLNRHGVKLQELINICSDLGSALQYLHEVHHIIHRDIKPENVFLSKTLDPSRPLLYKIGDMGEVTEVMKSDGMTHVSTLQTHGTFAYMAPEQLLYDPYDGTMKMGETTDLWGFGTILSEAAFGIRPFFHDQGHHIHMDISSYCGSIMDKSDETIHIYKEGQMRDPAFLPVHASAIPHNCTLPNFVVKKVHAILACALLTDRKKRGSYTDSSYGIHKLIEALTTVRVCQALDCASSTMHYIDSHVCVEDVFDRNTGIIVTEDLEINPEILEPGFNLYLTDYSESSVCPPKVPEVLENYFSEPFPCYRKGVERSLVGFVIRLKFSLEDIITAIGIIIKVTGKVRDKFESGTFSPFSTLVDFCDHKLYKSFIRSCVELFSDKALDANLMLLHGRIKKHCEYTNSWVETFRGITSKTEWTDVYLLVDNYKEHYSNFITEFAKLSGNAFSFMKSIGIQELKLKGMISEMKGMYSCGNKNSNSEKSSNIKMLLQENTLLFEQLKAELEDI